jgi:hypothetical protein
MEAGQNAGREFAEHVAEPAIEKAEAFLGRRAEDLQTGGNVVNKNLVQPTIQGTQTRLGQFESWAKVKIEKGWTNEVEGLKQEAEVAKFAGGFVYGGATDLAARHGNHGSMKVMAAATPAAEQGPAHGAKPQIVAAATPVKPTKRLDPKV